MDIDLLVYEMRRAFDILGGGLQNAAKTLRKLIECFCEEREEEKTSVSSPKTYGILVSDTKQLVYNYHWQQ